LLDHGRKWLGGMAKPMRATWLKLVLLCYTTHTLPARESTAHSRNQAVCTRWRHASMVPYKTLLYPRLGRASTQVPDVCIWMQYVLYARAPILLWHGSARDHGPSIDLNVWMGSKSSKKKPVSHQ
jgi:hypothetical protein